METKKEIKYYQMDYICPVCKFGMLRPNGCLEGSGNPIKYIHECSDKNCKHTESFDNTYPYIKQEYVTVN